MLKKSDDFRRLGFGISIFVFYMFFIFNTTIQAQNMATIKGVVADSLAEKELPGAYLSLSGTALGGATDVNGEFTIYKIPSGSYILKITYIGYCEKMAAINVKPEETVVKKLFLQPAMQDSESMVISLQRSGQLAAINQQLQSEQLVNVVSLERMRELPDAGVIESTASLPGVSSIRDGAESFISIRGMASQYTTITINGVVLPATD